MPLSLSQPGAARWAMLLVPTLAAAGIGTGYTLRKLRSGAPAALPAQGAAVPTTAEPKSRPLDGRIRIGLRSLEGRGTIGLRLLTTGSLFDGSTGAKLKSIPAGKPLFFTVDHAAQQVSVRGTGFRATRPAFSLVARTIRIGERRYPDTLRFSPGEDGLSVSNELDIETYLEGVLPGELPAGFGLEAQKALAVAARTYALVQGGKHGDFDLCDNTCCQMYLGRNHHSTRGLQAVRATRGQYLWSGKEPVYAFYSADCGGISTRVQDVPLRDKPDRPLPYLTVVRDAPKRGAYYCGTSPFHQWSRRVDRLKLEERLNARPETYVGALQGIDVLANDASGRITSVRLRGMEMVASTLTDSLMEPGASIEKVVTGWEMRRSVGARTLMSTLFQVDQPDAETYRFLGRGNGHGLGLCQTGANGMAKRGIGYRRILAHYYPGTRVAPLPR